MPAIPKQPKTFLFSKAHILRSRQKRDILWSWAPISLKENFELKLPDAHERAKRMGNIQDEMNEFKLELPKKSSP